MRPAPNVSGHWLDLTVSLKAEIGVLRSGVKGPFMCGSSFERSITTSSSYSAPSSAARRLCGPGEEAIAAACCAISPRCVDSR